MGWTFVFGLWQHIMLQLLEIYRSSFSLSI